MRFSIYEQAQPIGGLNEGKETVSNPTIQDGLQKTQKE